MKYKMKLSHDKDGLYMTSDFLTLEALGVLWLFWKLPEQSEHDKSWKSNAEFLAKGVRHGVELRYLI